MEEKQVEQVEKKREVEQKLKEKREVEQQLEELKLKEQGEKIEDDRQPACRDAPA